MSLPNPEAFQDPASIPSTKIHWPRAARIIRSRHPPIDLFEDIADPADWPLLIAVEQKTNPRLMQSIGNLDLVPPSRRVSGPGASWLMAPFTHISPDRPSRFSNGTYGVLYTARAVETALFETMHHHAKFMEATAQPPGWTAQFRELRMDISATLRDLLFLPPASLILAPNDYALAQSLGSALRAAHADGIAYPSVRHPGGQCAALFYPDLATAPTQSRHLDYHWNGTEVDLYRDAASNQVFRVT